MNQRLVLSTIGISLLLRHTENKEQGDTLNNIANAADAGPHQSLVNQISARVRETLSENDITRIRSMSAELNGLYALYDGQIGLARQDMQLIVSSDTALGRLCADLISEYLRRHGLPVQTMIPTGLTTATSAAFEAGIKSLIVECDKLLPDYHNEGYSVVFNLVGGFKALQGYLNTIGMFYADEMLYLFEGNTAAPIYIPRLPIKIDLDALTPYAVPLAMMAEAPTTVPLSQLGALQRTLYDTNDQENAEISQWGQLVWNQARGDLLSGSLLPFPLLRYETGFINDYKRTLNPIHRARLQSQLANVSSVLVDHRGNAAALKGRGGIEYDNYTSKQMNGKPIGHFRISDGVRVSCIADGGCLTLRHFGEHDYVNKNP